MQARADDAGAWTKGAGVAVKGHTTVGRHAAGDLGQGMDARTVGQRRHHQRRVLFRGAGHQVAQVVRVRIHNQ